MKKNANEKALREFWSKFHRTHWEKKPGVFKNKRLSIFSIDAGVIFELLVRYCGECKERGSFPGLSLYVAGNKKAIADHLELLPVAGDRSLKGYHGRVKKLVPDYCLVCDSLSLVGENYWHLFTEFINGLYSHIGMPSNFTEIGLYLGNYRKTPFGVHVDECSVFSIPVVGTKTFRVWNGSYVKKNPSIVGTHSYSQFKKHSKALVAKPGEIMYWPSSIWHVAESNGGFNATWSYGIWIDSPLVDTLMRELAPSMRDRLKGLADRRFVPAKNLNSKTGHVAVLPKVLAQATKKIAALSERETSDVILKYWLSQMSRAGFGSSPRPNRKLELKVGDRVRIYPDSPILWTRLHNGNLFVASRGECLEIPRSPGLVQQICKLNAGTVQEIKTPRQASLFRPLLQAHALAKTAK